MVLQFSQFQPPDQNNRGHLSKESSHEEVASRDSE